MRVARVDWRESLSPNQNEVEVVEGRVALEFTQDVPTYYVNHAELVTGMHECAIWFARLPARPAAAELEEFRETGVMTVEPEIQILIPYSMVDGLIGALEKIRTAANDRMPGKEENGLS